MEKLLTVVVPIYKVEKYINKCLDSLIVPDEQMKQLEVICVNDGTPDNSAVMAKEYVKRYPETFQVIDKENGGHGSAWNKGVELASGKYLRFLDSDDWLTNLTVFMKKLETCDVDVVFTNFDRVDEKTQLKRPTNYSSSMNHEQVYSFSEFDWDRIKSVNLYGSNITNFHSSTYRTTLLKGFHPVFLEKIFYDDEILHVLPYCAANSFVYFDLTLYNYLVGREGQTIDPKVRARNVGFKIKVHKYQVAFYKANKPSDEMLNERIRSIINGRISVTFNWLAKLPYHESLAQMKSFNQWLMQEYPEFKGSRGFSIYKWSPILYRILCNNGLETMRRVYNAFPTKSKIKLHKIAE